MTNFNFLSRNQLEIIRDIIQDKILVNRVCLREEPEVFHEGRIAELTQLRAIRRILDSMIRDHERIEAMAEEMAEAEELYNMFNY